MQYPARTLDVLTLRRAPHEATDPWPPVTVAQRVAWARERYFQQGIRPTGAVSEAVIQSWSRCLQRRHRPELVPQFNAVSPSRAHCVQARNRLVLEQARDEMQQLAATLAHSPVVGLLVDPQGVVIQTTERRIAPHERVLPLAARVGINLSEERVGTNAPAITAHTGRACLVLAGEHFSEAIGQIHCAAAPVRDASGRLVAVLDLSSEGQPFAFDAATLVGLHATAIENRLLRATAKAQVVVSLHSHPAMLDTVMAGLVGVAGPGQVAWMNPAAAQLLGRPSAWPCPEGLTVEALLGQPLEALLAGGHAAHRRASPGPGAAAEAQRLCLPSGLHVWMRCQLPPEAAVVGRAAWPAPAWPAAPLPAAPLPADGQARPEGQGHTAPRGHAQRPAGPAGTAGSAEPIARAEAGAAAATAADALTLRDAERATIQAALAASGGNVSEAARRLGISRGRVYRHCPDAARGTGA